MLLVPCLSTPLPIHLIAARSRTFKAAKLLRGLTTAHPTMPLPLEPLEAVVELVLEAPARRLHLVLLFL